MSLIITIEIASVIPDRNGHYVDITTAEAANYSLKGWLLFPNYGTLIEKKSQ